MNEFEVFTLCLSLISVVIAVVSLIRTRKIAAEQIELQRVTANLARKQLEQIERSEELKALPSFRVELVKLAGSYRFIIANRGEGSAYNVNVELVDCPNSPLSSDVGEKFPMKQFRKDTSVKLLASIASCSPFKYQMKISWEDRAGKTTSDTIEVTL